MPDTSKVTKKNVVFLFGEEPDLPPSPLSVDHLVTYVERPVSRGAAIDLAGKPKVLFLIGAGGTGKTTFARWIGERSQQREVDLPPVIVTVDPQARDLVQFFPSVEGEQPRVLQPKSTNPQEVVRYLERLFIQLMNRKRSAVIDFGGGDTALLAFLTQTPGLDTLLEEAGVEAVAMHFLSPRVADLTSLAAIERTGFQPRATALVLNVGRTTEDRSLDSWFGHVRRQPSYAAAIERGAVEILFPKLFAAKEVEDRSIGFWAATNNAPGPTDKPPLNVIDHRKVSHWLGLMEQQMQPIVSWIDL